MLFTNTAKFSIFLLTCQITFGQSSDTIQVVKSDSVHQVFHQNGNLFISVPYLNGLQHGWYQQYNETGKLTFKKEMSKGKTVDGTYFELWPNGTIYRECHYKNGLEHGEWLAFDSSGKPWKKYIFKKGKWVALKVWNDENNKWEKSGLY